MTAEPPDQFERALSELDEILRSLEDGTATLEESLSRYERGVELLRGCYAQLQRAEGRVKQLTKLTATGEATFAPFEHTSAVEKPARIRADDPRRGAKPAPPPVGRLGDDELPF